jgi:TIR domain
MTTRDDNVKVFISYSWSSPQHEQFVLTLAEKLMADGVHVLLDKWDLKEGHDKYAFMEQMVTDINVSKVLVISDKKYASKADNRSGGVGTESQIISNEVYSKVSQEKFIPIVVEYDGTAPCLPAFLKSLIYIDLTKEETYYDEYERLIRNIYNRPKLTKPMLGKPPAHIFDDNPTKLETASIFTSLKESIEKERKSSSKLGDDFLNQIIETLEASRITDSADIDDKIVASVTLFKPYRDQFVEYIKLLCSYDLIESRKEDIFSFLEKLLALHDAPKSMNSFFNGKASRG